MQEKQKDLFENRFQRLRTENRELREKLASQKKDYQDNLKSVSRNDMLLNAMPAGLVVVQGGKIRRINDAVPEYLGYESEDLMGAKFLDLIYHADMDEVVKIHKSWDSGRMSPEQYDARLETANGSPVFFNIKCKRIRFQNRTAFLLILACLNERLAQEQQNYRIKKAEALTAMAAGIKDHLGPLNKIILQTIEECRSGSRSSGRNLDELLEKLESASTKALYIINGLATFAGTGKDKSTFSPFNLNEAVKGVVQSANRKCRELVEARGIKISVGSYLRSSLSIEGDFKQMKEAIACIVDNALEAMPEGGDVHITTEDNNGDAHIYIQDSGTGIPEKLRDRIFDPFFTTKPGAIGLGLSLAGSIIKNHNGHIEIESSDGDGTIFHLRLPLSGQKIITKPKRGRRRIAGSELLVIQESDVAREVFSHLLEQKGCRLTKLTSPGEALGKMKNKSFEMIIADETALDMDWPLFVQRARKVQPGISIAFMTEDNTVAGEILTGKQKADLIIRKPIDVNSAVKHIAEILKARG